jgi:PAS domain S-box-containing protein
MNNTSMSKIPIETTATAFEAIFNHANIGLIVSDAQGLIEDVNPFATRLFGYEEDELIGKTIETLIPSSLRAKHTHHRTNFSRRPEPRAMGIGFDLMAAKKDGTEFPVEISLAHYVFDNKMQVVSFITDITLRKKAEIELKELNKELEKKVAERTKELSQALMELNHINMNLSNEMEYRKEIEENVRSALEKEKELNELKSRFVSMASHEFRTPLGGILTSAALISRYEKPEDSEKRAKHVNTIKAAVTNLTSILNDFLSLDKLETGKVECHPTTFSIRELASEIIETLEASTNKDQRILHEHKGSSDLIDADKTMLRNILINLLSNAAKYSPGGQDVYLTTESDDMQTVVTVQDFGIGIPEAEQKHLFERFFRAKNAVTIQGTGLGLHIIKKYLDLMEGSIEFTSSQNVGTTFTVVLPKGKSS